MLKILQIFIAGMLLAFAPGVALAQDGVLTVTDGKQSVEFDREKLAGLKQDVVETAVPWLEANADANWPKGMAKFSGPSFTDLLNDAGMSGETITVTAADGYSIEVPRGRLTGDGAILATSLNGEPLPEGKAPYWVIFPYDRSPGDPDQESWSVWQVKSLTVK